MIPKGLKVGDTFVDGGLTYKVTKVVGENYESAWVGATPPVAPVVEQPKITSEDVNYEELPYAQLKKLCAEKGLDATGKKDDLVARLKG
jgi:hypothetical protein